MSKLKDYRKQAGLTQAELAELAKVHRTVVARCEEGVNHPSYNTLCKLSKALGVTVDALMQEGG